VTDLISLVVAATANISSTLTYLLLGASLLVAGLGCLACLACLGRAIRRRREDRRACYAWHLRAALARMAGQGWDPHVSYPYLPYEGCWAGKSCDTKP
jgi:threonine/homoserine/homoserine lactone efflux protein